MEDNNIKMGPVETQHFPCDVLGINIGISEGWDYWDNCGILFKNISTNDLGEKFLGRKLTKAYALGINFETGIISWFLTKDEKISLTFFADWSIFNRNK